MKLLKFNANVVSFIIETDVLIENNIDIEHLESAGPLVQDLMEQVIEICEYDNDGSPYIPISIDVSEAQGYVYMVFGINVRDFILTMASEYIHNAVDIHELDEIDFDFSQYTMPQSRWDKVKDGTEVEMPIRKEKQQQEQSLYFEFNSLQDIEKYAKTKRMRINSDLFQKKNKFVLRVSGIIDAREAVFFEARIAEFNGKRIPVYHNDDCLIQRTALDVLREM